MLKRKLKEATRVKEEHRSSREVFDLFNKLGTQENEESGCRSNGFRLSLIW